MQRVKRNRAILWLTLLLLNPLPVLAQEPSFWTEFSTWNPIRDKISRPLEDLIPGLEFKGYIQHQSDFILHQDARRDQNFPRTNNTFQKSEFLFQLRPRYHLSDRVEFTGVFEFLYNAAYDYDGGFRSNFVKSADQLRFSRVGKRIYRELYVDLFGQNYQVRIGKQQVVWGKVDGRKILDIVNPTDSTRFPFDVDERSRIPTWMVNANYFWGGTQFQLLVIPDFESNFESIQDSMWEFNQRAPTVIDIDGPGPAPPFALRTVRRSKEPATTFEDSDFGFKIRRVIQGFDISLNYLYSHDDRPTNFFDGVIFTLGPLPFPGPPCPPVCVPVAGQVNLRPRHTRIHQIGGSVDKDWWMLGRQWALKIEAVGTLNKYRETADPGDANRFTKRDSLLTGTQLDTYIFTDWFLVLRWDLEHIFNWNRNLRTLAIANKLQRNQNGIFFTVLHDFDFTHDRLRSRFLFRWLERDGANFEPTLTYELTEHITLQTRGEFFWGRKNGLFGQFRRADGVRVGVRYSF